MAESLNIGKARGAFVSNVDDKGPAKTAGLAAMGLAAVGAVLHGMFARPNTVSPREEVEAEHLVQKARPTAVDR